jgi:hypothetical protein
VIASDVQTLPHSGAYGGELTRMAKAPHPGNRLLAYELGGQQRCIGNCSSPLPRRVMHHGMAEAKVLRSSRRPGCRVSSSAYTSKPSPRVLPAKRELDETTIGAPKLVVDASPVRAGNACNWRP